MILAGIIAASFYLRKSGPSDRSRSQEPATDRKEEKSHDERRTTESKETDEGKEVMDVYGLGYLYFLDPDDEQTFKERLTVFVDTAKIEAGSARVLEDHVDDWSDEKEPALFYLKLDDERGMIVQVSFDKTSGRYAFAVNEGAFPVSDDGGDKGEGRTEYEIPESSEDEIVDESQVSITDLDGDLGRAANMEELEVALTEYLRSIDEGRRNFTVSSVGVTEKGYEAVLDFSSVRHDGRNVEAKYDGTYHFRLV